MPLFPDNTHTRQRLSTKGFRLLTWMMLRRKARIAHRQYREALSAEGPMHATSVYYLGQRDAFHEAADLMRETPSSDTGSVYQGHLIPNPSTHNPQDN
jgi:hypothetical protein